MAETLPEAESMLKGEGITYIDLADLCPPLFALLGLRPRLGVRTFAHSVARLLNPLGCEGQLNGVFHTPYVTLMAEANALLGQPRSLIFMGAEGRRTCSAVLLHCLRTLRPMTASLPL